MKKIIIVAAGLFFLAFNVKAQDYALSLKSPAVYTQYYVNPILVNPAYAGYQGNHNLLFNFRNQWAGFSESPRAYTFSYNGPVGERVGIGGTIYTETYGVGRRFKALINYAYRFQVADYNMAMGLSTEYLQYRLDNSALTDPLHEQGDPLINNSVDGKQFFGTNVGIYGEHKSGFLFSLSLPNIINTRFDDNSTDPAAEETTLNYVGLLGYNWLLPQYGFTLQPSFAIRKIGDVSAQLDLNLLGKFFDDQLLGGLTYSIGGGNRFGFLIGANIERFTFQYSYDVAFLGFQQYNNGSHELSLNFKIFNQVNNKGEM